jgi:hypothetical protein
MAQRKMKCFILGSFCNLSLLWTRARNRLRTGRCAVNGLESSTPTNLCRKRTKLSKIKMKQPLNWGPGKLPARGQRRVEKAPHRVARKARLRKKTGARCLPGREQRRDHPMRKFACGHILFPNAAAGLHCQAMRIRIGSKPGDNSSPKSAHVERIFYPY